MVTAEEVIRSLPGILKKKPELRWEIYEVLSEEFARKLDLHAYMKRSDERFEQLFKELRALREDSNRGFDAMDRRFDDLEDWVGIVVGGFQRRAGRGLEDAIAGTLRIALGKDVKPEHIMMRRKITDDEGLIGPKGRGYEIDLCVTNEESLIFEIKSYAEEEDIERFNDKAELAMQKLGLKKVVKAFITLEKHPSFVKQCEKMGIHVG